MILPIGIVTASELNLREGPSTSTRSLARLPRGARVEVTGRHGAWYAVAADQGPGWVHGDHLRLVDPNPASAYLRDDPALLAAPLQAGDAVRAVLPASPSRADRRNARAWDRVGGLMHPLSSAVDVDRAAAMAVLTTESGASGFDPANQRMIIRFEAHLFGRHWGRQHPEAFEAHFRHAASRPWTAQAFRPVPDAPWVDLHARLPTTAGQDLEWAAFELAASLDRRSAIRSISMGAPQILGSNHATIGYDTAEDMFDAFSRDERYHLVGLFDFVRGAGTTSPMLQALQRGDYEGFASKYNGPGQAAAYGATIRARTEAFQRVLGGA